MTRNDGGGVCPSTVVRGLTKRLQQIVSAVPRCEAFADVGCDHGYIGIAVLTQGVADKVVFCDISAPSLAKAKSNCPDEFATQASFFCGDGLPDVPCDCACIAGMGGLETIGILTRAEHLPERLVLQPMRNVVDVRQWLVDNDYGIVTDRMFEAQGKYYDLITAEKGGDGLHAPNELQLHFGKDNLVEIGVDFVNYLCKKKHTYQEILNNCAGERVAEQLRLVNAAMEYITEELA